MAKIPDKRLRAYTEAALWYKALRETNNESFLPLFFDDIACGHVPFGYHFVL